MFDFQFGYTIVIVNILKYMYVVCNNIYRSYTGIYRGYNIIRISNYLGAVISKIVFSTVLIRLINCLFRYLLSLCNKCSSFVKTFCRGCKSMRDACFSFFGNFNVHFHTAFCLFCKMFCPIIIRGDTKKKGNVMIDASFLIHSCSRVRYYLTFLARRYLQYLSIYFKLCLVLVKSRAHKLQDPIRPFNLKKKKIIQFNILSYRSAVCIIRLVKESVQKCKRET